MKKIHLVDLAAEYRLIKTEVNKAIARVIKSSQFILADEVEKFEQEFAQFCGVDFCVGLDNGSSALELGMRVLGIGDGDEVITPVNSFIASSSVVSFTGAKPVWVDCDSDTYNIDVAQIERSITKKTKAIMPVHLYGQPAQMSKIKRIAQKYSLYIIEDACQAHGAEYKGKRVGGFGDFAAFSFYPGKNLGAYGDAGALVTNDKVIYKKVRMMRNYGQSRKYHHDFLAYNRRLDTIQAAVLRVKLRFINKWNKKRAKHALTYNNLLKHIGVKTPYKDSSVKHVYHQYVIRARKRNALQKYLSKKGISTGIHYPIPIHLQKAYKHSNIKKGAYPVSEKIAKQILSLPVYPFLTKKQIKYIVKTIEDFYRN